MTIKYLFYGPIQRLLHRFNIHHTTTNGSPDVTDGLGNSKAFKYHEWCQWCGLRGDRIEIKDKG